MKFTGLFSLYMNNLIRKKNEDIDSDMTTSLYSITTLIKSSLSEDIATVASKRYRLYLREEERKRRHTTLLQYIIAAILWLVSLITNVSKRSGIRKKRVIEKITVE